MFRSSALALNNEIIYTQGHTVQQSEKQLTFLLSVVKYYKIKSIGEVYEQISIKSMKEKQKFCFLGSVCCLIFLFGRQMDWKVAASQACLSGYGG